ncbi:HAD-IIIA family hydrolase [candidate division GN15 bacterium]|nr:HAD-IIIA family hydrolase [candidate division GN15 bacterium]
MNERILVIRFSSLGDILLTSPVVLNLKIAFPDARLVYLAKERFRPIVELFDGVDQIVGVDDRASIRDYYHQLVELDNTGFTHLIDLHGNPRSLLARKIVTAERKVVYPKRRLERQMMVTRHGKQLPETWPHTIDSYHQALAVLNLPVYTTRPVLRRESLTVPARDKPSDRPRVVIAPGAAHPPKQWGIEQFAQVANRLVENHDAEIIWAGTSEDTPPGALKSLSLPESVRLLIDHPLDRLAGDIASAHLTVANDSGIAHLSSAVGTPTLALFGPTHPALGFAPRGLHDRLIEVDEWCRPCSLHGQKPCFRDEQYCFTRIDPVMVAERAASMLTASAARKPALFLDRDGTVMVEKEFLADPSQVELETGVAPALRRARQLGYKLVLVSNQSGVARGYFGIDKVEQVNARLIELLQAERVEVDGVHYCPYHTDGTVVEYTKSSPLRKPAPGMPEQASVELGIDLPRSVVVGDRASDLDLGRTIGGRSFLVRTGYGRQAEPDLRRTHRNLAVCDTLTEVVDRLEKEGKSL